MIAKSFFFWHFSQMHTISLRSTSTPGVTPEALEQI